MPINNLAEETAVATMTVHVGTWDPKRAVAMVEIVFESFSMGSRWVDEPTLMVLTGSAADPALLYGKSFTRHIS